MDTSLPIGQRKRKAEVKMRVNVARTIRMNVRNEHCTSKATTAQLPRKRHNGDI